MSDSVEPAGRFALLFSTKANDSNGRFQVIALANDRTHLRLERLSALG